MNDDPLIKLFCQTFNFFSFNTYQYVVVFVNVFGLENLKFIFLRDTITPQTYSL